MRPGLTVLAAVFAVVLIVWLWVFCGIIVAMRRRGYGIKETPNLFVSSLGGTLNVLVFSAVTCWFRLRGKELPPPTRRY